MTTVKDVLDSLSVSERKVMVEIISEARKRAGRGLYHQLEDEIKRSLEQHIK